jgi:uncharacterized protein (TIRG00374 family)
MRKLFYSAILIFAVYFTFTHLSELQLILDVLGQGDLRWLLAAVVVQLLWLVNIAAAFQSTYHLVGLNEYLRHLVPLTAAANFINVVAPSYGLGALAVLIADGRRRSKPAAKVSTAAILYIVYDYLGFMIILALGLIIMVTNEVLDTVLIIASILAILITAALVIFTAFGIQSAKKLGQTVLSLSGLANRVFDPFLHRDIIDSSRAQSFANDFSEGLQHIRRSPSGLLVPGALALTRKVVMMTMLYLVSVAYHHPLELDTLIAGFCTSYLFTIASITPSGAGFVEGAMTLYLTALGVPLATSAAISIAYRGITFWLVLVYGMIAIRWVGYTPSQMVSVSPASANPAIPRNTPKESMHLELSSRPQTSADPDPPASSSSPTHKPTSS